MSSNPPSRRWRKPVRQYVSPEEELQCNYASHQIDGTFLFQPEFRLELVEGNFLVGGTLEGSRWLLKEALIGWGAEAAIAFAPVEQWWDALRISYQVSHQSPEEWLIWAENWPLQDLREGWGIPLGSQYNTEHRWTRDHLHQALGHHVSQACLGKCFGPQYGMWVGNSVLTPDLLFLEDVRLAENPCYDRYMQGPANLVIEIVTPEQAQIDEQVRRHYYEEYRVAHYWTINPIAQKVQFWQNSPEGFHARSVDPDGSYRGIPGITFTPSLLWIREDLFPSLPMGLPIIASELHHRRWVLHYEASETGGGWDSVPFEPVVGLAATPIQPQQFIAWCPESKLEGSPFPLIGGGTWGTRNAIAMLVMTFGLVETVKLLPGYEWVRVLRRLEREQQQDLQKRQQWWKAARVIAQQLQQEYGVGGIGVIGDLQQAKPLNCWSKICLVLWAIPQASARCWQIQGYRDIPVDVIAVEWATPAQWQMINQNMTVLIGEWYGQEQPNLDQRLVFNWL